MATTSISGVGNISSAGLGSGLDVNSIIAALMKVEQRPLDLLKQQATSLNTQISSYGKLQSYFSSMRDKAGALSSTTLWDTTTATVSDTAAVKVVTGSGTKAGHYTVDVQKLAAGQTVVSGSFASSTADLSVGSFSIELGTWSGSPIDTFTPKSGSAPVTIDVLAGETSLELVRDKINASGAGVVASIVNDATGARLSIRSKDTGAESAFRIVATETTDDGDPATGLSALNFDLAGGPSQLSRTTTAANAQVLINGISVSGASNTLNDVVDGLSLSLLKETTAPVDVAVTADTAGVKSKITDFVTSYNELNDYLRKQIAYNADSKTGGPLQGDQAAVALQNHLREVLNQPSSASSTWTRLSEVGISMSREGALVVDAAKLDSALANLPELQKLFSTNGGDTASSGFIRRYKDLADTALSASGAFFTRSQGLQDKLRRNSKSQDSMQTRLDQTEARLRRQYTALDQSMSSLNGLSSYVTQQMAMLAKNSGSGG